MPCPFFGALTRAAELFVITHAEVVDIKLWEFWGMTGRVSRHDFSEAWSRDFWVGSRPKLVRKAAMLHSYGQGVGLEVEDASRSGPHGSVGRRGECAVAMHRCYRWGQQLTNHSNRWEKESGKSHNSMGGRKSHTLHARRCHLRHG